MSMMASNERFEYEFFWRDECNIAEINETSRYFYDFPNGNLFVLLILFSLARNFTNGMTQTTVLGELST